MSDLTRCADFFREHDRFLIITHRRPDGDTLGSAAGLCHALGRLGKTARLFPNPEITELYQPMTEPWLAPEGYAYDTAVAVDVADAGMISAGYTGGIDLWLDHHPDRGEPRQNAVVWAEKASCGELVMELIEQLCGNIDREEADMLYTALSTDTGCFLYDNTHADTHRAAARLLEAGADLPRLNKLLFRSKSRARVLLEGMICASLRSYRENGINVAVVTLDMMERSGATEDDCNDLASLAGQVHGNRAAITVRELRCDPPLCKVSLRTDGMINAASVCARFGGGGHAMASGCELACGPEEAAERVRSVVEELWP